MSVSPGMFPALLSVSSAGPASQAAHGSASPRPPAPAAPNAARTCPHLHTKVDTNPPIKANNNETMVNVCMCVCEKGISCVSGTRAGFANGL